MGIKFELKFIHFRITNKKRSRKEHCSLTSIFDSMFTVSNTQPHHQESQVMSYMKRTTEPKILHTYKHDNRKFKQKWMRNRLYTWMQNVQPWTMWTIRQMRYIWWHGSCANCPFTQQFLLRFLPPNKKKTNCYNLLHPYRPYVLMLQILVDCPSSHLPHDCS